MNQAVSLGVVAVAVWLAGYGAAMIVQQHHRYAAVTRRGVRLAGRQFGRLIGWIWHRWYTQIIWAAIGSGVTLYLLGHLGQR